MPTLSDYEAVAEARTPAELLAALVAVAHKLGFPLFTAMLVIDRIDQTRVTVPIANTPAEFLKQSYDPNDWKRDPVNSTLRKLSVPFFWTKDTYVRAEAGDLWEQQSPFGYHNGVAVGLHLEGKRHFMLGVDTHEKLPNSERRLVRLLADVQFLAVHAQNAALRLLEPLAPLPNTPTLTEREVEVLRWTLLSKDAQAIADILGVRRRTVQFHVENAIAKLGCEDKHAAVLRALEYGLIKRP